MTSAIAKQKTFRLTVESWEGKCKRITVRAFTPEEAMALYMFGKWVAVDFSEIKGEMK